MKKADAIIVLLLLFLGSALTVYPIPPAHAQSPTFKMAANPSSLTFPTGSHKTSNITITSLYGFTGTISLSGESFPYQQVSVTLNVTSVYLPPYGVAYAAANVSASSTTTPYNYTIDVNGSGPGGYETAFLFALVTPGPATIPDFRLSANPDYLSAAPGTVHNVTVSVASLDGFVGDVSLRVFYPPSRLNAIPGPPHRWKHSQPNPHNPDVLPSLSPPGPGQFPGGCEQHKPPPLARRVHTCRHIAAELLLHSQPTACGSCRRLLGGNAICSDWTRRVQQHRGLVGPVELPGYFPPGKPVRASAYQPATFQHFSLCSPQHSCGKPDRRS